MSNLGQFIKTRPKTSFVLLLAALIPPCVAASLFFKTDTQKIASVISESKEALEKDNVEGAMRWVASDFEQEGMDKDGLRSFVRDSLRDFGTPDIAIWSRLIELDRNRATCLLKVLVRFPDYRDMANGPIFSQWQVSFRKARGAWHIIEVMPLEVGGYHPKGLIGLRYGNWTREFSPYGRQPHQMATRYRSRRPIE